MRAITDAFLALRGAEPGEVPANMAATVARTDELRAWERNHAR